ncbi:hypothetical protein KGQ34_00055 [Patescibacteria group bacterium]|nr:hypothetical protein [Patescibacteria group bacterium]
MQNEIKKSTSPKNVFLYLLAIITLYVSAGSFIALLFQYIDILFPDILVTKDYYYLEGAYSTIRWSIASLVIVFPVYIWISWFLQKEMVHDHEKAKSKIRKWLIYFTLFLAAIAIIADLVTLIFNLLEGEITAHFILKVLVVLFTAGTIFTYYLWDLRMHKYNEETE